MYQPGPLEGIKVLDFTHVLAEPHATMMLGEHTNEVLMEEGLSLEEIKVLKEKILSGTQRSILSRDL